MQAYPGLSLNDCVITCAGLSSRMGAWKPLLDWGGLSLIQRSVGAALDAGLDVVLVVGYRASELEDLFLGYANVRVVRNEAWESGLLGSVLTGLRASLGDWAFVANGDRPSIRPSSYRLLADQLQREAYSIAPMHSPSPQVELGSGGSMPLGRPLFAAYKGDPGHPVLLPRLAALGAERLGPGGRMKDHLEQLRPVLVETADPGVVLDIDTPEEYRAHCPKPT